MVVQDQAELGEGSAIHIDPFTHYFIQPSTSQPQKKQRSRRSKRKDIKVPLPSGPTTNVADEAVNEKIDDSLERAATTATSLDAEQDRVLALETTKTTQSTEIASLKKKVKKLESRNKSRTHRLKRLYRVGSSRRVESFEDEGLASAATTTTTTTGITDVEITLAQALVELKSAKPKANKVVIEEPEQGTTTPTLTTTTDATTITTVSTRPRTKGLVIHEQEQAPTPTVSSQQPSLEEANIAWDDVQAKVEADYQLAQRLQAQEQDELTNEEKARLFIQFLEQRRKHFAAKRVEEKRNIPPTRAQQRSIMCTYLKNMEGWKPKSLKNKSFANIQELFDKAMKRVNTFVDYRTELVEESSKKAEIELVKESFKKAEAEIAHERNDGDDVTIDATHLSTKSPTIMLKNFDKEDLEVLWSIVKAIFKKTDPVNYMDDFLLLNLKTMFEHHVKDNVWKNQQGLVKVLNWKLYDSCGVHCVTIFKLIMSVKWHMSFLDWSRNSFRKAMYLNEVFRSILLVIDEALNET
ncbi:hypothetical protein Tco_0545487 [Tanacetum coccineum]